MHVVRNAQLLLVVNQFQSRYDVRGMLSIMEIMQFIFQNADRQMALINDQTRLHTDDFSLNSAPLLILIPCNS